MASLRETLKDRTFENQAQLIAFLNGNYVWKADKQTESIYILDKSNPDRNYSREYKVKENKDKRLYLNEV